MVNIQNQIKIFLLIFTLFTFSLANCETMPKIKKELRFPRGCSQTGYEYNNFSLVLNNKKYVRERAIYFIHNLSNKTIEFRQEQSGEEPYVIQSRISLKPGTWAAFSANENNVRFMCIASAKDESKVGPITGPNNNVMDCKSSLDICEYANVKFGDNNGGNYWVTTNNTRGGAVHVVLYNGILLRGL